MLHRFHRSVSLRIQILLQLMQLVLERGIGGRQGVHHFILMQLGVAGHDGIHKRYADAAADVAEQIVETAGVANLLVGKTGHGRGRQGNKDRARCRIRSA